MVEQEILNLKVAGSNPAGGTIFQRGKSMDIFMPKIEVREDAPIGTLYLIPQRKAGEILEDFYRRCAVITGIGTGPLSPQ